MGPELAVDDAGDGGGSDAVGGSDVLLRGAIGSQLTQAADIVLGEYGGAVGCAAGYWTRAAATRLGAPPGEDDGINRRLIVGPGDSTRRKGILPRLMGVPAMAAVLATAAT